MLQLLIFGSAVWLVGWCLDVATTVRGIRRTGTIAWERNPLARLLLKHLGVRGGFAALALLESLVVAAHWATLWMPWFQPLLSGSAAASLALAGAVHALAAWSNHIGTMASVLLPIVRIYDAIDRAWFRRGE